MTQENSEDLKKIREEEFSITLEENGYVEKWVNAFTKSIIVNDNFYTVTWYPESLTKNSELYLYYSVSIMNGKPEIYKMLIPYIPQLLEHGDEILKRICGNNQVWLETNFIDTGFIEGILMLRKDFHYLYMYNNKLYEHLTDIAKDYPNTF